MRDIMKKMRVFSNNEDSEDRYVVNIADDGSCMAVYQAYEGKFVSKKDGILLGFWDSCEEIHEERYRAFMNGEMPLEYLSSKYKIKEGDTISIPTSYKIRNEKFQLYICGEWRSSEALFDDYNVLIAGEWIPVGVKL